MEAFIHSVSESVDLTPAARNDLLESLVVQNFSKKERIVEIGKVSTKLFFVLKGAVRSFQYRSEKEVTTWIYHSDMFLTSWDSFLHQRRSEEAFEITEDAVLISLEYLELQNLFKKHPSLEIWGRKLMEQYTVYFNRFNQKMRFATAQEKYDFYLTHFPKQPRIQLGYIASFLGITQATLSRLRKKN